MARRRIQNLEFGVSCHARLTCAFPYRRNHLALRIWLGLIIVVACANVKLAQQPARPGPGTPKSTTAKPAASVPQSAPSPQPNASPQSTPFVTPKLPLPGSVSTPAQSPLPAEVPVPSANSQTTTANQSLVPLTLDDALQLASAQASAFAQAGLNEQIAAEDVRQARAAFLPRVTAPIDYLYTSPAFGVRPRVPSFIANNAISEYQAYLNIAGDLDIAGRLRATLAKNQALLAAAHAGTEVARRALAQAVIEGYYGLAFASAQLQGAQQNLAAAEEFERITSLLLSGGEVAPVDLTRAQLQTTTRRDELERARGDEAVAAGALRVLIGYDFLKPIATTDLSISLPVDDEISRITADTITLRPEFAQFEAERRAAEEEVRIARGDRLPQLSYSILGGFDTDSLKPDRFKEHTGVSAGVQLSIPLFDWGASKSRERQARLKAQIAESRRAQALRGFAEQFYSARAQAISAGARIRLAATGLGQAENNLSASIARYRSGEAQIIEVTDAQTTLVAQRQAFYQALFDYQIALGRLRQAAGR